MVHACTVGVGILAVAEDTEDMAGEVDMDSAYTVVADKTWKDNEDSTGSVGRDSMGYMDVKRTGSAGCNEAVSLRVPAMSGVAHYAYPHEREMWAVKQTGHAPPPPWDGHHHPEVDVGRDGWVHHDVIPTHPRQPHPLA